MFRKTPFLACLLLSLVLPRASWADAPHPPAIRWISQDALIVLDISDPNALLDKILEPEVLNAITSSPAYKAQAAKPGFKQWINLIEMLESKFDTDWQTILRKLSGGGVTLAMGPGKSNLLIVDTEDAEMLAELHDLLRFFAKGDPKNRVASADYRGVTGWTFGPNEAHAILGNRLILTNQPEALKNALDLRAIPDGTSMAESTEYTTSQKALGDDAVASLYLDMGAFGEIPGVKKVLAENTNPMVVLLLEGLRETLDESNWLAARLDAVEKGLSMKIRADGLATSNFATGVAKPNITIPRQIASVSLSRDLHAFYAAKDELFAERTNGLIFFENMMGIFFTGRDLTEEVLAELEPEVRLVVAKQSYDPAVGTPGVQFPAFALIFRMKDPEMFSPVMEEAWQKALGLINFTRGQQAEPGLILDRPMHGGVKYTTAAFSAPERDKKPSVDPRFNFSPSLAMPGDCIIVSSTDTLTKDLIDALAQPAVKSEKISTLKNHSLVRIEGRSLASILEANRVAMVQKNMIEKGHSREEADAEFDTLVRLIQSIATLKFDAGNTAGRFQARVELEFTGAKEDR